MVEVEGAAGSPTSPVGGGALALGAVVGGADPADGGAGGGSVVSAGGEGAAVGDPEMEEADEWDDRKSWPGRADVTPLMRKYCGAELKALAATKPAYTKVHEPTFPVQGREM